MRILYFIPHLSGGGAERQLSYLAPELVRMGHDVHIAYTHTGSVEPELSNVKLHQLKSRSNYDPFLIWQILRLIRHIKPDIIQTWILQMDILGGLAARLSGIPWILREPSSHLHYPPNLKNKLRVWVCKSATAIVSNSQGGDEYWKEQLPRIRRFIITNGLPISQIERTKSAQPMELLKLEKPIVLYVGRLASNAGGSKNIVTLLKALAFVNLHQDVIGVICGEGSQRKELELICQELGIGSNVYLTGHLKADSVWGLMKKASVFVSLSAYEGCPNTVMEAVVCCCPLVLSDIQAHHELLDNSMAYFVDPLDIQQIADTIIKLLGNLNDSKDRAFVAKQKTKDWTTNEMACKYINVYNELIIY